MRIKAATGQVRAIFLVEPDESVLVANMLVRSRGIDGRTETELHTEARAKWLYGEWLTDQARTFQLPVHEPRPWPTLIDRIMKHLKSKAPLVG